MRNLFFNVLALFFSVAVFVRPREAMGISGGTIAGPKEFRSVVGIVLSDSNRLFCSGTLISPTLVLTAAHCVERYQAAENGGPQALSVHVGSGELGGVIRDGLHRAAAIGVNPLRGSFPDYANKLYDIAWIRLETPVKSLRAEDFVKPLLDFEELGDALQPGRVSRAVGFGCQDRQIDCRHGDKRWAEVTQIVVDPLIVGVERKSGVPLEGDSGGPLFVKLSNGSWRLAGATSGKLDAYSSRSDAAFALLHRSACWLAKTSSAIIPGADAHCGSSESPTIGGPVSIAASCAHPANGVLRESWNVLLKRTKSESCEKLAARSQALKSLDLSGVFAIDAAALSAFRGLEAIDATGMHELPVDALARLPQLSSVRVSPYFLRKGELVWLSRLKPHLELRASRPAFELFNAIELGDDVGFAIALASTDSLEIRDQKGDTPLLAAVWRRHFKMIDALLARNAQVNAVSQERQQSALHYAVIVNEPAIVTRLLRAGAKRELKNQFGQTPLDVALIYNSKACIEALAQ